MCCWGYCSFNYATLRLWPDKISSIIFWNTLYCWWFFFFHYVALTPFFKILCAAVGKPVSSTVWLLPIFPSTLKVQAKELLDPAHYPFAQSHYSPSSLEGTLLEYSSHNRTGMCIPLCRSNYRFRSLQFLHCVLFSCKINFLCKRHKLQIKKNLSQLIVSLPPDGRTAMRICERCQPIIGVLQIKPIFYSSIADGANCGYCGEETEGGKYDYKVRVNINCRVKCVNSGISLKWIAKDVSVVKKCKIQQLISALLLLLASLIFQFVFTL